MPRYRWSSASLTVALLAGPGLAGLPQQARIEAAPKLENALLSVSVNGGPAGDPVALLRGSGNNIYAPEDVLASWRLKRITSQAVTRDGKSYYLLNGIAGLTFEIIESTQTLLITASPEMLQPTRLSYSPEVLADAVLSGTGGFLNYDVAVTAADGQASANGAIEAGVFTGFGVGVASFVGRASVTGSEITRLETNWTSDDPARMRSLRLGDSISRGGVGGGPLRFGGVQFARNFAVQPGFITLPMPSIGGSAAVPSVVDIYINNALRGSRDIPPGPFEIINVPIVTGSGDVQLVVRDVLGREALVTQAYYASSQLLRRGLHDYSYEAGFLRRGFARDSNDYGPLMISGTHRYGFSDSLTAEAHVEATKDVQAAGIAASLALFDFGLLESSVAASNSERGQGALAGLRFERRTPGLSFGLHTQFTTIDYATAGSSPDHLPPAIIVQAFAGIPLGFASLGLSYLWRDGRSEADVEYVGANASMRLGKVGTISVAGRKNFLGSEDLAAELSIIMPLGARNSLSAGTQIRDGSPTLDAVLHRNLPAGRGIGYRVAASLGAIDRIHGKLSVQTDFGAYDAELTWTDGKTGVRLSTAGGIGVVGRHAFASRRLNQSFATVKVGKYADVRVYADNQLVGKTDRNGTAVVPHLRPFDRNVLRIELADLPMDAEIAGAERVVRPYNRSGVAVKFEAKPARDALVLVVLEDGTALPAGSVVRIRGQAGEFVSASGGEVYFTGLERDNTAVASWVGGSCQFVFPFVETREPQPRLGQFQCRSIAL